MPLPLLAVALISLLLTAAPPARAGSLSPDLAAALESLPAGEELAVIAGISGRPVLPSISEGSPRERRRRIVSSLRTAARTDLDPAATLARSFGARTVRSLWLAHAIALRGTPEAITALAAQPGIGIIVPDYLVGLPGPRDVTKAAAFAPPGSPPEWNIAMVGAPKLWSRGITGAGQVVAVLDTGIDATHPDLAGKNRPTYFWYDTQDTLNTTPIETDAAGGHGTGVTSLAMGGEAGGTALGMAPDARWVAVRLLDDQQVAHFSNVIEGYAWLLDPDDDQGTDDAPGVVNNSWGFTEHVGECMETPFPFPDVLATMRAAGVAMVFAGGNYGPNPATSLPPANVPGALAAGYLDVLQTIAPESSRGPSPCDPPDTVYPELAAPGVNIRMADRMLVSGIPQYRYGNGSSFAAPHVAGAAALLRSALPSASLEQVEAALLASAVDLGEAGPDNVYGDGLIDVEKAYDLLLDATGACRGDINLDGRADLKDLRLLRADWGRADCATLGCAGDLDFDDAVDQADLDIFTADLHRTCPER